jgi:hypothetical protein
VALAADAARPVDEQLVEHLALLAVKFALDSSKVDELGVHRRDLWGHWTDGAE